MNKEDYTKELNNIINQGLKNSDIEFLKEEVEKFLIKIEKPAQDTCLELASLVSFHIIEIIDQEFL
ncbi:hypothetical protein [Desulfurobacterium atlanticum]|uniref:Uncharacterized protein n=1 Tax=Desulfurobacterium atlanticum TaxID=240169 RepID=A0A238YH62_9BACT|nr:hypothetical protein [Desulfurobacterium atlanticum]SNR70302.1 hypothetical protein SAMN06265340_103137 [Desulfurobacterium atlanticum]